MLTVAVLGPVEVRRDGIRVPVPGGKTAELLVRLALEAGVRVRTERLIDDLPLFAALAPPPPPEPPPEDPLGALLDSIDPDALTPREALDALYRLKRERAGGP